MDATIINLQDNVPVLWNKLRDLRLAAPERRTGMANTAVIIDLNAHYIMRNAAETERLMDILGGHYDTENPNGDYIV